MNSHNSSETDLSSFASMLNSRLAMNARVERAMAFVWICGGLAVCLCLVGAGAAFALYGYSRVVSVSAIQHELAKALVGAFERAKMSASVSGTMSLAANSELRLSSGQRVKLAEGATVKVDPTSFVRVVGDVKTPQPSKKQLQENLTTAQLEMPFTTYTIFRSVNFGLGRVETGWHFDLSNTTRPKSQYCSYIQSIEKGAQAKYLIAANGSQLTQASSSKIAFNLDAAVANCIWFSGI